MKAFMQGGGRVFTPAIFCAALSIPYLSLPVFSAAGPGTAGMQALKNDISPRAMGMGGAFTAVADDIYAMQYNPAGLGQLYMLEAAALYLSGFEDSRVNNLTAVLPLPLTGIAGVARPSVGMSLMMADAGSFNLRLLNEGTGVVTERMYDAQKDVALTFGYGEKIYSEEIRFEKRDIKLDQYLGFNVKYLRSTLLENYTASGLAFDAGWLANEPRLGLSAGVSMANFGSGLKYISETTKLPSILRLGLAYQRPTVMYQSLLLAADADFYTAESQKSLRFGMEYHFEKIFSLRLGYKTAEDNAGLNMGLGIHYGDVLFDFATAVASEVYNTSQISFSYKFSGVIIAENRKKTIYKDPEPQKKNPQKPGQTKPGAPHKKANNSDFFWLY